MMPMSQIDMVALNGATLRVCGDFEVERGRSGKPPEVHVVVQQGGIVGKGQEAVREDLASWTIEVAMDQQQPFTAGPAIACGVIIVEKEPAGLEALSWVQEVNVLPSVRERLDDSPIFPAPEPVASPQGGQLPDGRAVSSSLAILPTGDGTHSWSHEVEIRRVEPAKFETSSRSE
jgi:hypothetical protein